MLKSLNIKNYAIIESLNIDFEPNFNVFTGETGAGKSIIVGALTFLLKGRSDSSVIKQGASKAIIEGVFEIEDKDILSKLAEQDIDTNGQIIVKRVISNDNKNSIKINESNVTLTFLTDLFSSYVDVHSQKDNHYLYNKRNQIKLLDKYGNISNLLKEYQKIFEEYTKIKEEYDDLLNNKYNSTEIDYAKFQLQELEEANIILNEEEELIEKEKRYKSKESLINNLSNAINLYDTNGGIKENLHSLINYLDLDIKDLKDISSNIESNYYEIDDLMSNLRSILKSYEDDDINIEQVEERLYLYSKLKRKHKCDVQGLINLTNELKERISLYENRDEVLNEKEKELNEIKEKLISSGLKLRDERIKTSKVFEEELIKESKDLLLNNINFKINFNETEPNLFGLDDIEFLVSMNKGEDLKPLKNVASGGETSRLMLALKVVLSKVLDTGLLILDEIDAGVSGKVALAVGQKIAKISKNTEVICISHLAPVAACANDHYLIYKEDTSGITLTSVKKLNKEEIIKELAIMSNTSTDQKALDAAKALYDSCQNI